MPVSERAAAASPPAMPPRVAWWAAAANRLLTPLSQRARCRPGASLPALRERAARRAGQPLADDDADFHAGLSVLARELRAEPDLTFLGWLAFRDDLVRLTENRLRARAWLTAQPGIAAQPVPAPVFVIGLPRTGTTLLHGLLASLPGHRAPLMWELLAPAPASDRQTARIRRARRMAALAQQAGPALRVIHPLAAEGSEECTFALPHSMYYVNRARLPGYQKWHAARDATPDYVYLRQQLQLLAWQQPPRRWILKSPYHLWALDAAAAAFPGATFVWTHRDPAAVLASWCSLAEVGMRLHNTCVDLHQLGADHLRLWAEAMRRAMAVRAGAPPSSFVDVSYAELTADPVAVAARVLSQLRANRAGLAPAGRRRAERHEYSLARYGLTAEAVHAALADYVAWATPLLHI